MYEVLFIGDLNTYTRSYQRNLAICRSPSVKKIHSINNFKITPGIKYRANIFERIFNFFLVNIDTTSCNKRAIRLAAEHKIDILWIEYGVNVYAATIRKIKKINPNVIALHISEDDMFTRHNMSLHFLYGLFRYYDYAVTTKSHNVAQYRAINNKLKTIKINDSYSSSIHFFEYDGAYNEMITHIGAFELDRYQKLLYLCKNGIKVNVWGSGWGNVVAEHNNLIVHDKYVFPDEYRRIISSCLININFLRKINSDRITSRSIEIPACNGFMLAERTNEQISLFREGIEADYFSSEHELLEKCVYYIENPHLISKIKNMCKQRLLDLRLEIADTVDIIFKSL